MKPGFVRLAMAMAMAMTALPSPADSLSTGRTLATKTASTIISTIDWRRNPISLNSRRQTRSLPCRRYMTNDVSDDDEEVRAMKEEIRQMKLEAMEKLNALDRSLNTVSNGASMNGSDATKVEQPKQQQQQQGKQQGEEEEEEEDSKQETKEFVKRVAVSNDPSISSNSGTATIPKSSEAIARSELTLLEGTQWKVVLNIGREPGTWMPKTWGVSGERLLLNMNLEFSPTQLYEREDFLGGVGGARVLRVIDNQLTLAPSLREGVRTIRVRDGGWRIAKGEGPMGSDLLRFYVEIDQEVSHRGGDVYCPAGRIYCTCGYFPSLRPRSNSKERFRKELDGMQEKAQQLLEEIDSDTSVFSFDKVRKSTQLFRLRVEMQRVGERYTQASVREPDKGLLQFSKTGDVGLTREGGVCCKVIKAMAVEYHILGSFTIASTESKSRLRE